MFDLQQIDLFLLEDALWIAWGRTGVSRYDFDFAIYFACRHPWRRPDQITAVGRFGVTADYDSVYAKFAAEEIRLIHSPQQQLLASDLTAWYTQLEDLTPKSIWFGQPPPATEVEDHFGWPVFLRGSRQTSRHNKGLSIISSAADYYRAVEAYMNDRILQWQPFVCREYVSLRPVQGPTGDMIPASFEFRTFWWYGKCVGAGPYWAEFASYDWTPLEASAGLAVAAEAARRIDLPFLVVDVAQTIEGRWLVIECNDGQESGYAGISPIALWNAVLEIERGGRS